jgi:signal transduction histidine kinase
MDCEDTFLTEVESGAPHRSQEMFHQLRREADRRLERFVAISLQRLGEKIGAKLFIIKIEEGDRPVIRATLTRQEQNWDFVVDDSLKHYKRPSAQRGFKPLFVLRSHFIYQLNLPHRWSGTLIIEYPGILILSPERDALVRDELSDFSREIAVLLMNRHCARLESCLNEEQRLSANLRALVSSVSKELYCLSSISIAMRPSYNVRAVLTKVLETALPVLRAKLGVIYFHETSQCITLYSSRSRQGRRDAPWFRDYFRSKIQSLQTPPNPGWFNVRPVRNHPDFPAELKDHLSADRIASVLEFSLGSDGNFLALGFLGLQENQERPSGTRLLMTMLNMIGLFLEHMSLMTDLERQVKLVSQQKLDMEKAQKFLVDHMGEQLSADGFTRSLTKDRLLDEIERSSNMTLLAELASGVAHQIRNPLSNLVYGLHLLKQPDITEDERRDMIETVTERVETVNRMINEFIHYTRIPELRLSPECINDVLGDTVCSFSHWFDLAEIELKTVFDPNLGSTKIDLFLISQTFHNIIKNALEAMHSNGWLYISTRKLKIRHSPDPQEFAEIVFEDNGPGVPPDDLDRVMKPFYSRKEDGLGLGLALVDHIIRAHGGGLTLKNRASGGLRVRIYLPLR